MGKNLNVRVVGKGKMPRDFEVYDADTSERLENILGIDVNMNASEMMATATITVLGVELDVEAEGEIEGVAQRGRKQVDSQDRSRHDRA